MWSLTKFGGEVVLVSAEKTGNNARKFRLLRESVALVCLSRTKERRVQMVVDLGDMGGGRVLVLGRLSDFRNEGVVCWQ